MRNLVLAGILAAAIATQGCSKSSGALTVYTDDSTYMKGNVGDSIFSVKGVGQAWSTTQTVGNITTWAIYGATTYNKTIVISMLNVATTGNFALGTVSDYAYYYPYGQGGTQYYAISGEVVLDQISPNLQGTFFFLCNDNVTNVTGSFSVPEPGP